MASSSSVGEEGAILAAVIRSSLDCIIVVDGDSRVIEFNPAAERTFGISRDAALGQPIGELIVPPHLRDAHAAGFVRYLNGGEPRVLGRRIEVEAMRSDGSVFPAELTITEVLVGTRRLFTASLRDLSDRRAVEHALKASEARLAAFFDHLPNTMYLKDADGRFIMANAEMGKRLHYAPADLLGLTASDVMPPDIAAFTENIEDQVRRTARPISAEQTYPLPNGRSIHVVVTRFPVPDAHGRMTNVGAMFIDVTAQKEAQIAMRTSEARFEAFMANAPIGMFLKDGDGRTVLANAEMRHAFPDAKTGTAPDASDRIGLAASELFDAETAHLIAEQDAAVLATGQPCTYEWHRPALDRYAWAATVRFPVHVDGLPTQIGGFVIDLTARKAAELALAKSREALHQSEKLNALGSLLAGVSHELNNPLSAVIGQTMMLEEDAAGTLFAARAERIKVAAERCARIVAIFLAMARQKPPKRAAVDIRDVVGSALELLAYGLRASDVHTRCDLAADLPMIHADADQLHQVLVNLIVNAQQALEGCPAPRELTIGTRHGESGSTIVLEVRDNGPGIPPANARRIFEPFFTTKPAGSGTGIGLSFSLGVIQAHGGQLQLGEVARGTCFVIELPVESIDAVPDDVSPEAAPPRRRRSVLVVDDDAGVSEVLGELIQREGYDVEVVGSGAAAQARLRERAFDLVLTDLRMPGMDGPALFAWIAQERPRLVAHTGFLTGDVLSAASADFLASSGRPYAEKPFTPATVRRLISELLGSEPG